MTIPALLTSKGVSTISGIASSLLSSVSKFGEVSFWRATCRLPIFGARSGSAVEVLLPSRSFRSRSSTASGFTLSSNPVLFGGEASESETLINSTELGASMSSETSSGRLRGRSAGSNQSGLFSELSWSGRPTCAVFCGSWFRRASLASGNSTNPSGGWRNIGVARSTTVWLLELVLLIGVGGAWGNWRRGDGVGFVALMCECAVIELLGGAWADDLSTVFCVDGSMVVEDPGRQSPGRGAGVELVSSWDGVSFGISWIVKRLSLMSRCTSSVAIALATRYGLVIPQYEVGKS